MRLRACGDGAAADGHVERVIPLLCVQEAIASMAWWACRRRWAGMALLCALVLLGVGFAWANREPRLMDRATWLADINGWWDDAPTPWDAPYQWLTPTRFFSHSGWWRLQKPFLYDVPTRRKMPLARLEQLVNGGHDGTVSWRLSPDGQWVLWTLEFEDGVRAARLDGSGYRVWPLRSAWGIAWLADGHRWVATDGGQALGRSTAAVQGDVADPRAFRVVPVADVDGLVSQSGELGTDGAALDDTANTVTVAAGTPADTSPAPVETLRPPPGTIAAAVVTDPSGRRLAWILKSSRASRLAAWLRRLARLPLRSEHHAELWTSTLDGTDWKEIGWVPADPSSDWEEEPRFVRWLPDGRHISFVHRGSLWSVPVAPER